MRSRPPPLALTPKERDPATARAEGLGGGGVPGRMGQGLQARRGGTPSLTRVSLPEQNDRMLGEIGGLGSGVRGEALGPWGGGGVGVWEGVARGKLRYNRCYHLIPNAATNIEGFYSSHIREVFGAHQGCWLGTPPPPPPLLSLHRFMKIDGGGRYLG